MEVLHVARLTGLLMNILDKDVSEPVQMTGSQHVKTKTKKQSHQCATVSVGMNVFLTVI